MAWGILAGAMAPTHAEGSRNLFPANAPANTFRGNIEWRPNTFYLAGQVARRTLLRVYARQGESILLGSSAVGVGQGNILVYDPGLIPTTNIGQEVIPPPASASFNCVNQRTASGNPAQGFIGSRAQELAGPAAANNVGGYSPCIYQAPTTGIYTVVMTGPAGFSPPANQETAPTGDLNVLQTGADQNTSIAAWDVTVRSGNVNDTTSDQTGRLFTYYLTLFTGVTGAQGKPIGNGTGSGVIYAVTTDGYIYRTGLNGIDPNGFVAYGNQIGFQNGNVNTPLNYDLVANDDLLTAPLGGVTIAPPEFPLFFDNPLSSPNFGEVFGQLGIPSPVEPFITPGSFGFTGTVGGITSTVSSGGTFAYEANVTHVAQIVISRDGQNFDPTNPQNRVLLQRQQSSGQFTITWDGLDNSGNPFPVGNYQSQLLIRTGEYHFPLLDVEGSPNGSPFYELLNPPGGNCFRGTGNRCTIAFYDDRGYRGPTATVGTIGQPLPGAPNPPNSNPISGFDTFPPNQRAFNRQGSAGFGDRKGLDLWTFYPSASVLTPLNIIAADSADLRLTKTAVNPSVTVGQNVTFIITLTNNGPATATNVAVTDQLPAGLAFVSATPGQGTFDAATGVWTVGTLAVNTSVTLEITATLTTSDPVANIAQVTNSDQPDPTSTPSNNVPTEDDQSTATIGLPNLRLVKRITAATRSGVPTTFSDFVDDPADANDTAAGWTQAQFSPVGVPNIPSSQPLQSGDEVEYTIYFLSDGSQPALDVSLCDQVPPLTTLINGSPQVRQGNANPTPGGTVFSPLAPLPSGNSCQEQTNPNGSVIFTFPQISNAAGSNFGFVRIRVRIN